MKKIAWFILIIPFLGACSEDLSMAPQGETGQGGSLARFTIVGDRLYTVDPINLTTYDISSKQEVRRLSNVGFGWGQGVETIYPFQNNLFLGTETGMLIFSLENPDLPRARGTFSHLRSCDPVVTDGEYAYVTLRASETRCFNGTNQLDILDVTDVDNPTLLASYGMKGPKGLGIRGSSLFVCDDGLKVYDVTDVMDIELRDHFQMEANDVIVQTDKLIVIASHSLYQYSYVENDLTLLSKMDFRDE